LVPLIWVAPAHAGGPEVEATSKVSPNVSPTQLVEELERHLEVQLGREPGSTAGGLAGESTAATPPPGPSTGGVEVDRSAARQPGSNEGATASRSSAHGSATAGQKGSRASEPSREPVEGRDYVVEPIDDELSPEADPPSDEPTSHDTEGGARGSEQSFSSEEARNTGIDATSGTFGGGSTVFPASGPADSQPSGIEATDIERKIDEVRHQDYFAILEVERTADTDDIRQAYDRMRELYHPDAVNGRLAQSYADDIREIGDALTDAFAVLADRQLRQAYLDATTRKS
jgi:DnaJ-domain-containing protein 1